MSVSLFPSIALVTFRNGDDPQGMSILFCRHLDRLPSTRGFVSREELLLHGESAAKAAFATLGIQDAKPVHIAAGRENVYLLSMPKTEWDKALEVHGFISGALQIARCSACPILHVFPVDHPVVACAQQKIRETLAGTQVSSESPQLLAASA